MLQVSFLRQNKEIAKQKLAIKHFANLDLVDTVIAMDDERKQLQINTLHMFDHKKMADMLGFVGSH